MGIKDELLALKLKTAQVTVPGLSAPVTAQEMSVADRDAFNHAVNAWARGEDTGPNPTALAVVFGLLDESGERAFKQVQDVDNIVSLPASAVEVIAAKVVDLSAVDESGAAVEAAAGNSEAAQSGDSSSNSPETSAELSPS